MRGGAARLDWLAPDATREIAARLRAGDVLALPTETLYGLSCLARSDSGRERIVAAKRSPERRGFVALVDSAAAVEALAAADVDARGLEFLRATWPAPLTAVLATRATQGWGETHDGRATAAFRVPAHARLRALLAAVGEPVLSTSANRAGEPPLPDADAIEREFGAALDAIVFEAPGAATASAARRASTVADFGSWPPRVVRAGAFDLETAMGEWLAAANARCGEP